MKTRTPDPAHKAFRDDMVATLRRHAGDLPADHLLAVAAYTVGQLIALQDQRLLTPDQAMDIVARNIELGNSQAIDTLLGDPAGEA